MLNNGQYFIQGSWSSEIVWRACCCLWQKCAAITINRFAIAKIQKYKKDLIAIYLKDKNQTIKLLKKAFAKMNFLKRSSQEIKFAKFSSKVAKVLSN